MSERGLSFGWATGQPIDQWPASGGKALGELRRATCRQRQCAGFGRWADARAAAARRFDAPRRCECALKGAQCRTGTATRAMQRRPSNGCAPAARYCTGLPRASNCIQWAERRAPFRLAWAARGAGPTRGNNLLVVRAAWARATLTGRAADRRLASEPDDCGKRANSINLAPGKSAASKAQRSGVGPARERPAWTTFGAAPTSRERLEAAEESLPPSGQSQLAREPREEAHEEPREEQGEGAKGSRTKGAREGRAEWAN